MNPVDERRQAARRSAEATGKISFGSEGVACRVIDVSATGAQVRIDGRRANRNMVGKRISLAIDASADAIAAETFAGRVVWARPAVNGVYLGLAFNAPEGRPNPPVPPGS